MDLYPCIVRATERWSKFLAASYVAQSIAILLGCKNPSPVWITVPWGVIGTLAFGIALEIICCYLEAPPYRPEE
jgi:ABC-type polysaccharide/polyol phosphate export permease